MEQSDVRIERYADQGRCVAHIDGRVVFVRFALPGELVRVTLDEPHNRADRFWTAEVAEVLEPSADRVSPPWPLAGPVAQGGGVGGADLIHFSLPGQLRWKQTVIQEQMRRLGHQQVEVPVEPMPGDERLGGLHWRTRVDLIADDEGRPSMRRRGSHTRVALSAMPLATQAVLKAASGTHVWDGGFVPGSRIRLAAAEHGDEDDDWAVMVGHDLRAGSELLDEHVEVEGRRFAYKVSPLGFWQVHREAPGALCRAVFALLQESTMDASQLCLWDLYSGAGLFTLPMAAMAAPRTRVLSVEGDARAARQARRNLTTAGLAQVEVRHGDVERVLARVPADVAHPDAIVLDPPRSGARRQVCRMIADSGARAVIYVACDPTSLARDTTTLREAGYALRSIRAYDIYPMTHHVESVALFVPDGGQRGRSGVHVRTIS